MDILDKICEFFGLSDDDIDLYNTFFNQIDADGNGELNYVEFYEALAIAGLDITKDGVLTFFAMIDEDGDGK